MTHLTDLLKPIRERLAAIVEWNTNYKGTVDKTELLVQFEGARIALLKDATDLDRLLRVAQYLSEALNEINIKLTPKIPRMDGKDSWTIQQKFVDKITSEALSEAQKILEEK